MSENRQFNLALILLFAPCLRAYRTTAYYSNAFIICYFRALILRVLKQLEFTLKYVLGRASFEFNGKQNYS